MRWLAVIALVLLVGYGVGPYVELYRLDRALAGGEPGAYAEWVDLDSIRHEIRARLNKEMDSAIGEVSNDFIEWLEGGLRRLGAGAVERLVTLEWVRERLVSRAAPGEPSPLFDHLDYAFFERLDRFTVRLGPLGDDPVHFQMRFRDGRWRITAIYN